VHRQVDVNGIIVRIREKVISRNSGLKKGIKMKLITRLVATVTFGIAISGIAAAQESLPIADYPAVRDVPGAVLFPDTTVEHKVVFDNLMVAENTDDVNPMLLAVARYVNTLAKYGVPAENRKIAIVMHRGSTPITLTNETFSARNDGHDNPNIKLIQDLHAAGVKLHLCGQAAVANDLTVDDLLDEVQLDLWALTTIIDYQQKGYSLIGG
jgi:intracellular sulfur oxidation DsrE/DsrF family protein